MKHKRQLVKNFSLYIDQVVIYLICQKNLDKNIKWNKDKNKHLYN